MDEAGLSKGQFRVLAHIWRRRDCTAAVRDMAHDCRMNHFYVRLVIRYLVERKMITRELRAGKRSWLALTPTESWLVLSADQKAANAKSDDSIKQLALDVQQEFYDRLHVSLNRVEAETFAGYLAQDGPKFDRVMKYVIQRIADGKAGLQPRVLSAQAMWTDYWKRCK
jgi:DNA-binding MarR family transcriptional regulator